MTVKFVGSTFLIDDQWGPQESRLIENLTNQINIKFPNKNNLLINLTWFGPQFNNQSYHQIIEFINKNLKFDNLFWLSSVDPIYILPDKFASIEAGLGVDKVFYIGGFETSPYYFTFSSIVTMEDFLDYTTDQIILKNPTHLYLCYNRKPKPHRIQLVEKIYKNKLESLGILTLGKNDVDYDVSEGQTTELFLKIDENKNDYTYNNKFLISNEFGGIPWDLLSLGRLDIWQHHFLNIVSETEFLPWDNMFITEKTWKPIIGLRPFVLNGQTKIYKYLRDNGFYTFNHYWPHIEMENLNEFEVHNSIISVIKFLSEINETELLCMYKDMLPALEHNRSRFFEFAKEQKNKVNNLFSQ